MYFDEMQKKIKLVQSKKDVLILGIESSCDETSIAVVKNGREVLSNVISTQIDIHTRFGGVVPEVASRNHILAITNVLSLALKNANITLKDIDAVAVTYGAGLIGALMVGVSFAKSLAFSLNIPLIAVNHIRAHVSANYICHKDLTPPFIALIVSGGHTAIEQVKDYIHFSPIGSTLDDAIGEAYDKVARVVGLGYPGGPKIDKMAKTGKSTIKFSKDNFKNSFDCSYSGLKTAVINYVNTLSQKNKPVPVADICASFQTQAILPLVDKSLRACKKFNCNTLCVAGGVSANSFLRETLATQGEKQGVKVLFPDIVLCTDNAAMVASLGYFNLKNNVGLSDINLDAVSNIPL
jgi:N6-L-threonylcarbamoyladenine synthase